MGGNVIEVEGLTKVFGDFTAAKILFNLCAAHRFKRRSKYICNFRIVYRKNFLHPKTRKKIPRKHGKP